MRLERCLLEPGVGVAGKHHRIGLDGSLGCRDRSLLAVRDARDRGLFVDAHTEARCRMRLAGAQIQRV